MADEVSAAFLRHWWPSLASPNFRLYIAGQTISLIGTFMQMTAMSWLVYRLTHSEFILGLVGFLAEMPGVVVALAAGVLVDRANPRKIVLATQSFAMLQAFVLAALVFSNRIDIVAIILLACALGFINGFDVPARQVLVAQLLDDKVHLRNAIALVSLSLDGSRLIGAAMGGLAIAAFGEGTCFLINGASYAMVIVALLAIRLEPKRAIHPDPASARTLIEGLRYAFGARPIRSVVLLVACVSFAASPYAVLLPVMAGSVLEGGPRTLGALTAAAGLGAIVGAFFLGSRPQTDSPARYITLGAGLFGLGLLSFSFSRMLVLSAACLAVAGFGVMILMASSHTILLSTADEDKRGRVMSLFTLSFMATVPLGSLVTGALASRIGAAETISIGGALCILSALVFALRQGRLRD